MPDREDLFGLMSEFGGLLEQLDNDLGRYGSTRYINAAKLYSRNTNAWIKSIIEMDKPVIGPGIAYVDMIVGQPIVERLKHAKYVIGQGNLASPKGIVDTFSVIDQAMGQAYLSIQAGLMGHTIFIEPPSTYEKTLSVLPGDPDFPTEPKPEVYIGGEFPNVRIPEGRRDNAAASFLPGDPEFPTEPEPDPMPKRRSDDFLA